MSLILTPPEAGCCILPECCICGKIRDELGNWQTALVGQGNCQEIRYTHTLCPECDRRYYAEFYQPGAAGLSSSS